jgi:hypothetical protein
MDGLTDAERAYDAYCAELDAWEYQAQRLLDGEKSVEPEDNEDDEEWGWGPGTGRWRFDEPGLDY